MVDTPRSLDAWLELDDAETEAWYRFRDLRDQRPSPQTVAAIVDEREAIVKRHIFTRSLRVER